MHKLERDRDFILKPKLTVQTGKKNKKPDVENLLDMILKDWTLQKKYS